MSPTLAENVRDTILEARQFHDLNIELLETLGVIAERFFEYTDKYGIHVEGLDSLSTLVKKARKLLAQLSDDSYPGKNPTTVNSQKNRRQDNRTLFGRVVGCPISWGRPVAEDIILLVKLGLASSFPSHNSIVD